MSEFGPQKRQERRKGRDPLLLMMSWIGIIGWMILSAVMIIVDRAKPDDPIFMPDRTFFEHDPQSMGAVS